jgi:ribosomal protein L37E
MMSELATNCPRCGRTAYVVYHGCDLCHECLAAEYVRIRELLVRRARAILYAEASDECDNNWDEDEASREALDAAARRLAEEES